MAPGQFTLISNYVPTLPAGDYVLHAAQGVTPGGPIDPLDASFRVVAPRYILPADQVLSTYPPNRAAGAFSTRLPQIVLRRRTLPWERRASGTSAPSIPWLALVLLADGEGEFKTGLPIASCVTTGVSMPGDNDAQVGDALTVSNKVVKTLFPAQDEVELLAHVRRVDLTDTELALGDDDGLLAVVVSNRLPLPNTAYTAYLISLENQIDKLVMSAAHEVDDGMTHGVLVPPVLPMSTWPVLAHWSFACVGEGDFQSLMQGLDVGMLGTVVPPKPVAPGKPPPPPRPNPPEVLATGHLAVDHTTREGEARRSWYRGPLVPFPGTRDAPGADGRLPLLHTSDQARRIGPDGRENLALATAFEIGRLLALAEPAIVAALLLWRKESLNASRTASLLAAEPALAALQAVDVGSGFAARAGLDLLTSLGADDAQRLGGVMTGAAPAEPEPEQVMSAAGTLMQGLGELSENEGDEFAALRSAVEQATARLAAATGEEGER
jgi:hypothetical protein